MNGLVVVAAVALVVWAWRAPDWSPLGRVLNKLTKRAWLWFEPLVTKDWPQPPSEVSAGTGHLPPPAPELRFIAGDYINPGDRLTLGPDGRLRRDGARVTGSLVGALGQGVSGSKLRQLENLVAALVAGAGGSIEVTFEALDCGDLLAERLERFELTASRKILYRLKPAAGELKNGRLVI